MSYCIHKEDKVRELVTIDEALDILLPLIIPAAGESLSLTEAQGRIACGDVQALMSIPPLCPLPLRWLCLRGAGRAGCRR